MPRVFDIISSAYILYIQRKGFGKNMKIYNKIKTWGNHHHIELFGILLSLVMIVLVVNSVSILINSANRNKKLVSENAIFVNEFTTSLSGKNGEMVQLYINPQHNKCVLLFKFDDMTSIVTDATKYQVFIKSYDIFKGRYASTTKLDVDGGFYVFGSTGYTALYLSAANGFPKECYEVIVRCKDVLEYNAPDVEYVDDSYNQFDQWRVIINPNGNNAKECNFLDDFNITSLYQDAVIDANESEIRNTLTKDIAKMYNSIDLISNYRSNLKNLKVKVPSVPLFVASDEFSTREDGSIKYTTEYEFENGVNYEWYEHTLHDTSFIDALKDKDMTDNQFFNTLNSYGNESIKNNKWYMQDGAEITDTMEINDKDVILNNVKNYDSVLNEYYEIKKEYHTKHLVDYLKLESKMKDAGKYFTSNYSEGVVTVW